MSELSNKHGLCDLHGNIFEWCRDWYHTQLPGGVDPDLHDLKGAINRDGTYSRVRRGGAWTDKAVFCRSALRLRYERPLLTIIMRSSAGQADDTLATKVV